MRTYPYLSVRRSVRDTFGFPFCQRLWDLTKRRNHIVVADMVADMVVGMEVDKVAAMVAAKKNGGHGGWQKKIDIDNEIQFG